MSIRASKKRIGNKFNARFNGDRRAAPADDQSWLNAAPIGREFGSKDYDRFEQLDGFAFDAFGDMKLAQQWLSQPHPALNGKTPNDCARSDRDLLKALELLADLKRNDGRPPTDKPMPSDGNHTQQ